MRLRRTLTIAAACLLLGAGCRFSAPAGPRSEPPTNLAVRENPAERDDPAPTNPTLAPSLAAPTPAAHLDVDLAPMPPRAGEPRGATEPIAVGPYKLGERRAFAVADLDTADHHPVWATLAYTGTHVRMWLEEGASASAADLARSVMAMEQRILPTLVRMYGSSAPVIPQYEVLNLRTAGASGYYVAHAGSSGIHAAPYFVMNLSAGQPGSDRYNAVLAHELQHLWMARVDPNEDIWVNEGASQLAEMLAGYPPPLYDIRAFEGDASVALNDWSTAAEAAHYGASFLFLYYFYEQYGVAGLQQWLGDPAEGTRAIEHALNALDDTTTAALYADWAVANWLDAPGLLDGRGGYRDLDLEITSTLTVSDYPADLWLTLQPYASHVIELLPNATNPLGTLRITMDAPETTTLVAADTRDGERIWWSNRGDSGHAWMQRAIDISETREAWLTFDLWYDIEPGWDYAGVRVSTDGGSTWACLEGQHSVTPPAGTGAPTHVYTGASGDGPDGGPSWVRERIDLTPYDEREILLRWDMYTDDGTNRPGLCLRGIGIEQIGWNDTPDAVGGWELSGFAPIANRIPVSFSVQAVVYGAGHPTVHRLETEDGTREWLLEEGDDDVDRVVLIISALTEPTGPKSTEQLPYLLTVQPVP